MFSRATLIPVRYGRRLLLVAPPGRSRECVRARPSVSDRFDDGLIEGPRWAPTFPEERAAHPQWRYVELGGLYIRNGFVRSLSSHGAHAQCILEGPALHPLYSGVFAAASFWGIFRFGGLRWVER